MPRIKDGFIGENSIMLPKSVADSLVLDPMTKALYMTWIGYYPKAKYHHRKRDVPIDQYILIYCVDGEGWYKIHGKKYSVTANQFFVLPAGVPHEYASVVDNPWTIYWVHFKGELARHIVDENCVPIDILPASNSRILDRISIFEELYSLMEKEYSASNFHYASALFHYFISSLFYINQFRMGGIVAIAGHKLVSQAIHFMKENIDKKLTLKQIADYVGFSASYLTTLFKREMGTSPLAYLNMLRIDYACKLIETTRLTIMQISCKVGITDSLYFSRLFLKVMGMSPTKYRKKFNRG